MENVIVHRENRISISVVSHGQMALVFSLLQDLHRCCSDHPVELLLTLNIPEPQPIGLDLTPWSVRVICNDTPKGFGANHNQAFSLASGEYFCVLNPDIRLSTCPFAELLRVLHDPGVGVVGPQVLSPAGQIEDSARKFPKPQKIVSKLLGSVPLADYPPTSGPISVDWIGGMFMLFRRTVFKNIQGFDERYFLYYEDVDLCARLHLAGLQSRLCPNVQVVHDARRSSHRKLRYLLWHVRSMLRFFSSPVYRRLQSGAGT